MEATKSANRLQWASRNLYEYILHPRLHDNEYISLPRRIKIKQNCEELSPHFEVLKSKKEFKRSFIYLEVNNGEARSKREKQFVKDYWNAYKKYNKMDFIRKYWDILTNFDLLNYISLLKIPEALDLILSNSKLLRTKIAKWSNYYDYNINVLELIDKEFVYFYSNDKIDWYCLCYSSQSVKFITKHWKTIKQQINWHALSSNPNAIPIIKTCWTYLVKQAKNNLYNFWYNLGENPNAINLLKEKMDSIDLIDINRCLEGLCKNPNGMDLLNILIKKYNINFTSTHYDLLSKNPNAIVLFRKIWPTTPNIVNIINWSYFCRHQNNFDFIIEKWPEIKSELYSSEFHNFDNLKYLIYYTDIFNYLLEHKQFDVILTLTNKQDIRYIINNDINNNRITKYYMSYYEYCSRQYFRTNIEPELMAKIFHPKNEHKFASYQFYDDDAVASSCP